MYMCCNASGRNTKSNWLCRGWDGWSDAGGVIPGARSDPARTNCKSHQLQRELGWNQPGEGFSGQEGPLGAVTKAFCNPKGPRQVEVSPLCCLWCEPHGKSRLPSWLPGEAAPIPISPALLLPHPWECWSAVLTVLKPSPSHPCTPWAVLT